MNIMGTSLWSIGFSVVVARPRKLLKRLMATPMPRAHSPRTGWHGSVFLVLEAGAAVFAYFVFGVAPAGSIALVAGADPARRARVLRLGLLISTRSTTIEGVPG